jgi:DNA helicase-2/ATP-dependent DNA helicase PcrA
MEYEKELQAEKSKLKKVQRHIEEEMGKSQSELKLTNDFTELALNEMRYKRVLELQKSWKRPYFARVQFQEKGQPYEEAAAIGRFGLYDRITYEPIVMDWRSPMAQLYYDHAFDPIEVDTGKTGQRLLFRVLRKRQLEMQEGEISHYFDMTPDSTVNQLLLDRLQERGEQKLKDIVETIQAEQNDIIRADAHQILIVQGVAGSGKTTIALHRLAYLAYSYKDRGSFDHFLIVAPNRLFIDYISNVLPELGVEGVTQETWEDLILDWLPKKKKLIPAREKITLFMEPERTLGSFDRETIIRATTLRGSMAMKDLLDRYILKKVERMLPDLDLELSPEIRLSREEIRRRFHEDFQHYPYLVRRERLLRMLERWVKDQMDHSVKQLEAKVRPGQYATVEEKVQKLRELFTSRWESYRSKVKNVDLFSFYQKIITQPKNIRFLEKRIGETWRAEETEQIAQYIESTRHPHRVDPEDLAPLLYLSIQFNGKGKKKLFSHIVVDEAQDLMPFQLYVLSLLSGNGSMTILGDISQSIYTFKGLTDWTPLMTGVFPSPVEKKLLKKSYRSTVEIMKVANAVIQHWEAPSRTLAEPVLRHGKLPTYLSCGDKQEMISAIQRQIGEWQAKGYQNLAIIDKTEKLCLTLQEELRVAGVNSKLLTLEDQRYEGGVSIVPIYLSKGMEFDAVLLVDPHENKYSPNLPTDVKLLYVAMTRALHELRLIHVDPMSPLLKNVSAS